MKSYLTIRLWFSYSREDTAIDIFLHKFDKEKITAADEYLILTGGFGFRSQYRKHYSTFFVFADEAKRDKSKFEKFKILLKKEMTLEKVQRLEILEQNFQPQTELERTLINNDEFITGCFWGKARSGHPEGAVYLHIKEVLWNIHKANLPSYENEMLRFVALVHDTFKYKVDLNKPKHGENHHGYYARKFAEQFINDPVILNIIQHHDDAYNAWQKGAGRHGKPGDWKAAEKRALDLFNKFSDSDDDLRLFMLFYKADGETGDKKNNDYVWFEEFIKYIDEN